MANASGATDFAIAASSHAGQSFTFSNLGAATDAIGVDQITLSLKKTGTTAATATVSIRNAWNGSVLWSDTVSTSQLGATNQDIVLTLDKSGSYVTDFAMTSAPLYSIGDHTLTWTFSALGSAKTIAAGQAISLKITNSSVNPADHFKIAYDSDTRC